ncbi:MAG: inorganic diphosphatase [Candidatus Dormibacteraeota bacterium]|nr:inorganic diphosphatase [Candidatus Dormibacteraeota bacterium]
MEFTAVIEVPKGSRNKYEMNHETGVIELDRELFTSTRYPSDYGFIPETLAGDGDPLDVLVLVDEPTFPGCYIRCRPLGVFWMHDENGPDAKILAAPAGDPRISWGDLDDVPHHIRLEIGHFFDVYKDLEPGKSTDTRGWSGRRAAIEEIEESRNRYKAQP